MQNAAIFFYLMRREENSDAGRGEADAAALLLLQVSTQVVCTQVFYLTSRHTRVLTGRRVQLHSNPTQPAKGCNITNNIRAATDLEQRNV